MAWCFLPRFGGAFFYGAYFYVDANALYAFKGRGFGGEIGLVTVNATLNCKPFRLLVNQKIISIFKSGTLGHSERQIGVINRLVEHLKNKKTPTVVGAVIGYRSEHYHWIECCL